MTNRADFVDALDDCISRLNAGEPLEACLQRYPEFASRLRPLLIAGRRVHASRVDAVTVAQARERVRTRVAGEIDQSRRQVIYWPGLALAASLVLVFALVFGGGISMIQDRMLSGASPSPAEAVTLTPLPTDVSPSPTATATETVKPTETLTDTASPTATGTATSTATLTSTATPAVTLTATMTPSRTPTRRPTNTSVPAMASTCEPSQPDGWVSYAVRSGETLSGLASRTGTTLARLMEVNCIEDASLIVVGQQLYVPRTPQPAPISATIEPPRTDNSGSGSTNSGTSGSSDDEPDDDDEPDEPDDDSSGSGSGSDDDKPDDD